MVSPSSRLGPIAGALAPHQRATGRWHPVRRPDVSYELELGLLERDVRVALEDFDRRLGVDVSAYGRVSWPAIDLS